MYHKTLLVLLTLFLSSGNLFATNLFDNQAPDLDREHYWNRALFEAKPAAAPEEGLWKARFTSEGAGPEYFSPGLYVAAGLSFIEEDVSLSQVREEYAESGFSGVNQGELSKANFEEGLGANFLVGVGINRFLSFEVHVDYLTKIDDVSTNNVTNSRSEIQSHMVTVGVKLGIPIGRIRPYGFLGIGLWNASYDETVTNATTNVQQGTIDDDKFDTGLKFGGGLEIAINEYIGIYGEVMYLKGMDSLKGVNYGLATIGIILRL